MAIGPIQRASEFYDLNRDMYYSQRDIHEREAHYRRQQEEEYRRMQQYSAQQQAQLMNAAPKPDLNDPLGFLSKADNKILLTGEAA